jgi:hypothetical protein
MAFFSDIFRHLSELSSKQQEKCQLISEIYKMVASSQMKLSLFHSEGLITICLICK